MHYFSQPYFQAPPLLAGLFLPLVIVLAVWTIAVKGYALWHAARNGQRNWFIAILILNTVGILEVVYLIWFRTKHASAQPSSARA